MPVKRKALLDLVLLDRKPKTVIVFVFIFILFFCFNLILNLKKNYVTNFSSINVFTHSTSNFHQASKPRNKAVSVLLLLLVKYLYICQFTLNTLYVTIFSWGAPSAPQPCK